MPRLRNLSRDRLGNVALQRQQVLRIALVLFRPELTLAARVDQLHGDANAITGRADAAFDHVAHAEVSADFVGSFGGLLELHRRCSSDDAETRRIHPA